MGGFRLGLATRNVERHSRGGLETSASNGRFALSAGGSTMSDGAAPGQSSAPAAASSAPQHGGLVLVALISVAAVANLNLAVANVALPDIGKAFDSSQTALDLVAVGFSLGLAASVLYLGALGDRYGRKQLLVLGVALSIPASLLAAWAPSDRGAHRGTAHRWNRRRDGVPDHPRVDHRAVVRARPDPIDRVVVGNRRRHLRPGAGRLRSAPAALLVGVGLPGHAAVGRRRVRPGGPLRAGPRQRDERQRRQPRRHPLRPAHRGHRARDQLRPGTEQGHRGVGPRGRRRRRRDRLHHPAAAGEASAL